MCYGKLGCFRCQHVVEFDAQASSILTRLANFDHYSSISTTEAALGEFVATYSTNRSGLPTISRRLASRSSGKDWKGDTNPYSTSSWDARLNGKASSLSDDQTINQSFALEPRATMSLPNLR